MHKCSSCSLTSIAWNSMTDLVLTFLPFLLLKNLNMKVSTKTALSIIMGMSIFAMIACIVKTVQLKYIGEREDFTYETSKFAIWFTTESYVVIIAASIPSVRPLLLKGIKHYRAHKQYNTKDGSNNSRRPLHSSPHWEPARVVRLHRLKSGEKLEVEEPYIHSEPRRPPEPGTIRRTISIHIHTETRTDYDRGDGVYSGTEEVGGVITSVSADVQESRAMQMTPAEWNKINSGEHIMVPS